MRKIENSEIMFAIRGSLSQKEKFVLMAAPKYSLGSTVLRRPTTSCSDE